LQRELSRVVYDFAATLSAAPPQQIAAAVGAAYVKSLCYPKSLGSRVIIVSITYTRYLTILGTRRPHTDLS